LVDFRQIGFRTAGGMGRSLLSRLRGVPRWLGDDIRTRLVHIEDKVDDVRCGELRDRLIHIERKVDQISNTGRTDSPSQSCQGGFAGHPDQAFGHLTYAQFGEDLIVVGLFGRLGISQPSYLDIGAHHPLNCSNTALLYARGSRGVNVDANPTLIEAFHELRPEDITLNCGVGPTAGEMTFFRIDDFSGRNTFDREVAEAFVRAHPEFKISSSIAVRVRTINEIVTSEFGGHWPDLLSLDAEGLDLSILEAAKFGDAGPIIIIVEAISGDNLDASDALYELLGARGYQVLFQTPGNLIAVRSDAAAKLQPGTGADALVRSRAAPIDDSWAERIRVAAACPDAVRLPRVKDAGGFVMRKGQVCQVMHNGVLILRDSYIGPPMTTLIEALRGVHEPQEECCFAEVLPFIRRGATMIELGSNWGFYSLWFERAIEKAECHLIELDTKLLEAGIRNFAINGARGVFTNACLGLPNLGPWNVQRHGHYVRAQASGQIFFACEPTIDGFHRNIPLLELSHYLADNLIETVDLLHCDIQGEEMHLLEKDEALFRAGKVDWIFMSTHHDDEFHGRCVAKLEHFGFVVVAEHSISQSYSGDGLIVAKRHGVGGPDTIAISRRGL
jgi:FkbM family methyltransferase